MFQDGVWQSAWRRGRRVALVGAGLWCIILGIGVTASLIGSGSIGKAGTPLLLGAVGMLVLPGLTALALRLDSRERKRMLAERAMPGERVAHPAHPHDSARREPPAHRMRGRPGERVGTG
ncbi:MAG: hypothetical protein LAT64_05335 [Phycisphaerales bacterium]|nr:hypothetical protein [Planctomycetota bacterium]MCH8508178.1 hypothetical protein [Phycisphaerales bacterium]TVQ60739.1 MAG: hypothetical protein EA378_10805 [Phycisphaerales bacterium]